MSYYLINKRISFDDVRIRYGFINTIATNENFYENRLNIFDKIILRLEYSYICKNEEELQLFLNTLQYYRNTGLLEIGVYTECINFIEGFGLKFGDNLNGIYSVKTDGNHINYFNLFNLEQSKCVLIDTRGIIRGHIYTLAMIGSDYITIQDGITDDFVLGQTLCYPVIPAYIEDFSYSILTKDKIIVRVIYQERKYG